jgi:hypothetical protein
MKKLFLLLLSSLFTLSVGAAAEPAPVKLRTVEFKDADMGGVVSHTMLVPEGWKTEGDIRWYGGPVPIPEPKITIFADDGTSVSFIPTVKFEYVEWNGQAKGLPAPDDFGKCVIELMKKNSKLSKVKLIDDTRDEKAEAQFAKKLGGNMLKGSSYEFHNLTINYEEDGTKFTEETRAMYGKMPEINSNGIYSQNWMVCFEYSVRAPSKTFDEQKPLLFSTVKSFRPTAKWFTQMIEVRGKMIQMNHENAMAAIRARGRHYDSLSDSNMKAWKESQAISDKKHNSFINNIYEVNDFRDSDGLTVKLPHHYKNYYSDGQGNYLLTNSETQPRGDWSVIKPVR